MASVAAPASGAGGVCPAFSRTTSDSKHTNPPAQRKAFSEKWLFGIVLLRVDPSSGWGGIERIVC
jgi:hypothetical protein